MKKNNHHQSNGVLQQREGQEQCKKLHRCITEHAKRLDDARACAQTPPDLFTPKQKIHRAKFRDYCERLIFTAPLLYGHKATELLWRKCYYDIVATAKKLKKSDENHAACIESHLNGGVGYYQGFIARLAGEFGLDLRGFVDFGWGGEGEGEGAELKQWALESVHRCLIYLGDLCRYKLDIYPNWDASLAIRFYSQALYLNSEQGMPHNQMGTLATAQNRTLDAVYHYMHCLASKISFDGTENNLQRLFERNSQFLEKLAPEPDESNACARIKTMLARFFLLIDVWYFEKTIPHIYNLCHNTYIDFEACLVAFYRPLAAIANDSGDDDASDVSDSAPAYVTCDSVFKIVACCLLCIEKLQKRHSNHLSTVVAFTLAVYSQLIQRVIGNLERAILSFPLPHKKKIKLRRRRKSVDSDSDDDENSVIIESSDDETLLSDGDDDDDVQIICSSDEEEKPEKEASDAKNKLALIKKLKQINPGDVLDMLAEENFLQSIKVINDWLISEEDVLKSCSKSSTSLLRQITHLLNLLNIDFPQKNQDFSAIPLPEDVLLKGVELFAHAQKGIVWRDAHKAAVSGREEVGVRVQKILEFGRFLARVGVAGVGYDGRRGLFVCEAEGGEEKVAMITFEELEKQNGEMIVNRGGDGKEVEPKNGTQLINKMKHMGQLWLAAEVRALESRVKGKTPYSPYLVLDADALIKHTYMVKHLVSSRKFIIIVPSAVVGALDDLKREKLEARDAIRWLETQFHQGNRFFRGQRPHERTPLPFIKYPKKKDKAAFTYIQIIECCHYFAEQQKGATNFVTLLMGTQSFLPGGNGEKPEISCVGLAKSAGVQIELIGQFYARWKKTVAAGKGKR